MGVKCSCMHEMSRDEGSLRFEGHKDLLEPHLATVDIGDLIRLQGVFRGYIDRRRTKSLYNNNKNSKSKALRKSENPDLGHITNLEPADKVPDYSSKEVQNTTRKLGNLKYQLPKDNIKRSSHGPILLSNRAVYIGEWNDSNQRDGFGMQIWPDSSIYEGYWKADFPIKGRLIFSDGDAYDGDFVNNKALGQGTFYSKEGTIYTGEWHNDKRQGQGNETTAEGSVYTGEYHQDKKHGNGIMTFIDKSQYNGEFWEDQIHGKGEYRWNDGREYVGDWVRGKMHGQGIFIWQDGRRYDGEYHNDQKHGFGKFISTNGASYEGYWLHGKKHGLGVQYFDNGIARKGEWEDGKRIRWVD